MILEASRHQLLKMLFQRARELPAEERSAFITAQCGQDLELANELRKLLAHDSNETLAPSTSAKTLAAAHSQLTSLRPARRLFFRHGLASVETTLLTSLLVLTTALIIEYLTKNWLQTQQAGKLKAQCRTGVLALHNLLDQAVHHAGGFAIDPELAMAIEKASRPDVPLEERRLETTCPNAIATLKRFWGPQVTCVVWNREQTNVLGLANNMQGLVAPATQYGSLLLNRVLNGESVVYLPNNLEMISQGFRIPAGMPMMSCLVPVRAEPASRIMGAALVRSPDLEAKFHELFDNATFLKSGEMYAFTEDGRMISRPRFRAQLEKLGLIESVEAIPATTYVALKDPGVDLTEGRLPKEPRAIQPVTELVRRASVEPVGTNVNGYRDYRGRLVVGSWEWIERFGLGVAVEIDQAEMFEPVGAVNWLFRLAAASSLLSLGWLIWRRLRGADVGQIVVGNHSQIGQYRIERLIGTGGMGQVFKAQHDLLKRPTALKIMKTEVVSPTSTRRFSREVKFASRLRHPNTVSIYDYGCADDGRFYYAMEYLIGICLHELVRLFGPLPPARAAYILRQICGSLQEAHQSGIVHRDIKPQNIMLCNCGGETDFVKVLDFGLVKRTDGEAAEGDTSPGEFAGTPKYMAPERLLQPGLADPRVDVYSVGMTFYWMLTGRDAFDGLGVDGLLSAIMTKPPSPFPADSPVPIGLQQVVMQCLAKVPSERPASVADLWAAVERVSLPDHWSASQAQRWWQDHLPELMVRTSTVTSMFMNIASSLQRD